MNYDAIVEAALGLVAVVGIGTAIYVGFRLAMVLVRRLERRVPEPGASAEDLVLLRQELVELHERVDFTERMLAQRPGPAMVQAE
jgi:hypothetical protein